MSFLSIILGASMVQSANLGYPRIGKNREWKFLLEKYWKGDSSREELLASMRAHQQQILLDQKAKGLDFVPVGDFSLYDSVLDLSMMLGVIPKRFQQETFASPVDLYFGIARGTKDNVASEMTKWFNTNYHYIVPELDSPLTTPYFGFLDEALSLAKETGINARPVIVGLFSYIHLAKKATSSTTTLIDQLLDRYLAIFQKYVDAGITWVQIDETHLIWERSAIDIELITKVYEAIKAKFPSLKLFIQTYFESVKPNYSAVVALPVDGIGLDFVENDENLSLLTAQGFPADKILGVGIINGKNIWKADLNQKTIVLDTILSVLPAERVVLQSSCSLQFSPLSLGTENKLDTEIKNWLSFAEEKLDELAILKAFFSNGADSVRAEMDANEQAMTARQTSSKVNRPAVQSAVAACEGKRFQRATTFVDRKAKQQAVLNLPLFPTTTIGSFPQTAEVRANRKSLRDGVITQAQYDAFVDEEMARCIKIQEEIGLDVLVHGEFERNDMVEFFGENMDGFAFTGYGWVQSYGSRCVKPPIIYGDVDRPNPMTVEVAKKANALSDKEVKGMLTGPVTILAWSFVRDDQPRNITTLQIALALKKEVLDLEATGVKIIQIDEPAVREKLPLRKDKWSGYLAWATNAFRATHDTVQDETQIHTHMCYCDFNDIIEAIQDMDADCISIESSRSDLELLQVFDTYQYRNDIGIGVYDIHSPRIPSVEEMKNVITASLSLIPKEQFWVNPDCGLKTRTWDEVIPSLKNMVQAAKEVRG